MSPNELRAASNWIASKTQAELDEIAKQPNGTKGGASCNHTTNLHII